MRIRIESIAVLISALLAAPLSHAATPAGYAVDSSGKVVVDIQGRCVRTIHWSQDENYPGCIADADRDGIADAKDQCPDTVAGRRVDLVGCDLKETMELKGVVFALGSDVIDPSSGTVLDETAALLIRYPDMVVEVAGHTDNTGERDYNIDLSRRRAEAVRQYLMKKGITEQRLSSNGYGPDRPVADNGSEEGRAKNRRVEIVSRQ